MERFRYILFLLLAVAVAIPVVVRSRPGRDHTAPAAFSVLPAPSGYVQVDGDVRHPGVYPLTAKTMTSGVMEMAEPLRPVSTLMPAAAEKAAPVSGDAFTVAVQADGTTVVTKGGMPASSRLVLGIPLDINTVSEAELDKIPGIGPGLAQRIVLYRHKNGGRMAVHELQEVEGVGEKRYADLKKYFQPADIK